MSTFGDPTEPHFPSPGDKALVKAVRLSDEAYEALMRWKRPGESISDLVIRRLEEMDARHPSKRRSRP